MLLVNLYRSTARQAKPTFRRTRYLLDSNKVHYVPAANFMRCELVPNYDHVEYPERKRLRFFDKVPQLPAGVRPPKMMKRLKDMRGPELIHNKLQYADFGIQALGGGCLRWGHLEMIRLTVNRMMDESRMFAVWRVDQPWKPVTKKGQGHRMGGGKGAIDHYVFPLKANRIIIEVGGKCEYKEVYPFLNQVARILPFKARAVSRQILEKEQEAEKYVEENNINPFNFKDCIRKNYLGCSTWVSPYDYNFHGKHR